MPRRPNDLTPIDPATPTDPAATPTSEKPAKLPKPPRPPRPSRLADAASPAKPGRRSDTPSDLQMTKRIPRAVGRQDPTPAPLPPSPGARDAEKWFEQVPTNPAHVADLADASGSFRKARTSERAIARQSGPAPLIERPWVLPTLIAAIALTIGMILGALLFGGGDRECPPCDERQGPKQ